MSSVPQTQSKPQVIMSETVENANPSKTNMATRNPKEDKEEGKEEVKEEGKMAEAKVALDKLVSALDDCYN